MRKDQLVWACFYCTAILLLAAACGRLTTDKDGIPATPLLAQVFNYTLYYDDIDELLQGFSTPQDSLQQVRSITEHWVRDRLLLVEAEKKFPKDVNLNKLLEDYRQSLLRHFFEQQTIAEHLDTTITEQNLQDYYANNREQHKLESGIIRGYFFKIAKPLNRNDKILQWWRTFPDQHLDDVLRYMNRQALNNWADTSQWHEMQLVIQLFPLHTLSPQTIRSKRSVVREDRDYIYLLYPLEVYYEQDIAPLSHIREQAARFILHQRELEILERIKKEIYDRDIQDTRVKIYTE